MPRLSTHLARFLRSRDLPPRLGTPGAGAPVLQDALRRHQAHLTMLQAVLDSLPDPLIFSGPEDASSPLILGGSDKERVEFSALMAPFLARSTETILFNERGHEISPDDFPLFRAQRGETITRQEVSLAPAKDVPLRYYVVSASPVVGPGGQGIGALCLLHDFTEDHERRRMRDDFLCVIGHEMRTPTAIAKGRAQLLLRRLERIIAAPSDTARPDALDALRKDALSIEGGVDRMARLIEDTLDFGRISGNRLSLSRRTVNLVTIVHSCVTALGIVSSGHTIEIAGDEAALLLDGDGMRLEQVVSNLIVNAIKYSSPHSPITVGYERHNQSARLWVHNDGPGIPQADRPFLFRQFYRTGDMRTHRSGLGLGLFIAQGIVEAHDGTIALDEGDESGTTFVVTLPLLPD